MLDLRCKSPLILASPGVFLLWLHCLSKDIIVLFIEGKIACNCVYANGPQNISSSMDLFGADHKSFQNLI